MKQKKNLIGEYNSNVIVYALGIVKCSPKITLISLLFKVNIKYRDVLFSYFTNFVWLWIKIHKLNI